MVRSHKTTTLAVLLHPSEKSLGALPRVRLDQSVTGSTRSERSDAEVTGQVGIGLRRGVLLIQTDLQPSLGVGKDDGHTLGSKLDGVEARQQLSMHRGLWRAQAGTHGTLGRMFFLFVC